MTERPLDTLPNETALALLEKIAPGSHLLKVELLPGSFSNHTHLVEARLPKGNIFKFVVRRYQIFVNYDRGEKARREFMVYKLMNQYNIPAPEPLLLDDTGTLLEVPGIVTRLVPGALVLTAPSDPLDWARKLAVMLARIHAIPLDKDNRRMLLDANAEATWFLNRESAPEYMESFPGGSELWQIMQSESLHLQPVQPTLVHCDYWEGNILWHEGEISAVLDWEEAAFGDPIIDVAYARLNMIVMGSPEAAEEFLHIYESETGRRAENLGFWEMAAAVRPMVDPLDWQIHCSPRMEFFQQFMEEAKQKVKIG
jgi:aminoglycoside phosphotransferase (APT) family kinase protein